MRHSPVVLEEAGVGICVAVIQGSVNVPDNMRLWFLPLSGRVVQKIIEVKGHELGVYGASAAFGMVAGIS